MIATSLVHQWHRVATRCATAIAMLLVFTQAGWAQQTFAIKDARIVTVSEPAIPALIRGGGGHFGQELSEPVLSSQPAD